MYFAFICSNVNCFPSASYLLTSNVTLPFPVTFLVAIVFSSSRRFIFDERLDASSTSFHTLVTCTVTFSRFLGLFTSSNTPSVFNFTSPTCS